MSHEAAGTSRTIEQFEMVTIAFDSPVQKLDVGG